jgi:G3E family GTPase
VTLTTLVLGNTAALREAAIASAVDGTNSTALILEGIPDGSSRLDTLTSSAFQIFRIAPGCMCCSGNLTMRVTLNRVLRNRPSRLYIGIASSGHLGGIRDFLAQAPYDNLLELTKDLYA